MLLLGAGRRRLAILTTLVSSRFSFVRAMATTPNNKVNLLDLAAACVACTETASMAIQKIAAQSSTTGNSQADSKNTRLKEDGSFVTDADFAAQGVIVQAVRSVSEHIRIVGEESAEEMAAHIGQHAFLDDNVLKRTQQEIRLRYHQKQVHPLPLAQGVSPADNSDASVEEALSGLEDPDDCIVDASRVGIIVDPLDGTKSYAHGEYGAVSILICIILDYQPFFGVIGKPFGYLPGAQLSSMLDTKCVTIYGGPLLNGVYIAGGKTLKASPITTSGDNEDGLPRAVISGSRSKGVVHDFCVHLGEKGLIHKEPLLISGAGEKSLRLILQINNEALWFFPKSGTSLWDVAAPDALLRSLGGKLTDKYGNEMDYSKTRTDAENMEGVVACIDADLHEKCIRLFREGDWVTRR